ncbi:MAG: hypothetical protein JJU21_04175 [Salinarimonas sp.]|nr:hypothetical protein [Salinarimonas sp.]
MSVLMTMSIQPRSDTATQPTAAERASNGNRNVEGEADAQSGGASNVWRDPEFAQAIRASGSQPNTGSAATATSGPLVGTSGANPDALIGTLANDLARTFAEAPAPDNPTQLAMLHSLSRHIAEQEAGAFMPAPARSDYVTDEEYAQTTGGPAPVQSDAGTSAARPQGDVVTGNARPATRQPTQETIPNLPPGQRAIFAADGHLTPHANPDLIDVFKHAVERNNDWSRVRMSAPPDRAAFRSFGEPGANDRGPVTPETERVVRDHLQQEHDIDLQALPVRQMMIDDLFDTNEQLVLMNDILEKIVDEVAAKSPLPPSDVDRLRFVKESEVLARGFMNDIIEHFMNRPRED